ncbi:hypothetical protein ACQEU6_36520 [Spirillospora sp. CA-108201]
MLVGPRGRIVLAGADQRLDQVRDGEEPRRRVREPGAARKAEPRGRVGGPVRGEVEARGRP